MNKSKGKGNKKFSKKYGEKKNQKEGSNSSSSREDIRHDERGKDYTNDASWYTRNSQLALDAGRIAFTWPVGAPIHLNAPLLGSEIAHHLNNENVFPGVMALRFIPTYGMVTNASDPINVSAKNIYSWVRHANSGHSNYDAPDLMLYLLAVDSIYMYYQHLCRIYGLLRMFAQKNRHLPETILQAMNVDFNSFYANMADFRAQINIAAVKIGSLCVPATMPLFTRHSWMCSGVYADSPSIKSQFYVYKPEFVGRYDEYNGAGRLVAQLLGDPSTPLTYANAIAGLNACIDAVVQSEDMNIMSGDILKAYGENGLLKISMIGDDYMVAPVYNEEVLRQIQNATIINGAYQLTGLITQDLNLNILTSTLAFYTNNRYLGMKKIFTGTSENPDPAEVLVSSRLTLGGTLELDSTVSPYIYKFTPSSLGSEVVMFGDIVSRDNQNPGNFTRIQIPEGAEDWTASSQIAFFNYHPMYYAEKNVNNIIYGNTYFDLDNYAILDNHDIDKLHNTALLSMFDVPQLGRV